MKKLFSIYLALIASLSLWAGNIITYTADEKLSETRDTYFGSGFRTNAFNVSITSHTFSDGTGIITFNGEVTTIGDYAFYGCSSLASITIPNSVTNIGNEAFSGCSGLASVHITDIAAWCGIDFSNYSANPLYYAKHLFLNDTEIKNLMIPNTVTNIRESTFQGCSGLTSITIPNSVVSIGDGAFCGCSGLISVTIGNSVTSIGNSCFSGCSGLTSLTIGNSVTSIGYSCFSGCSGLTSIAIPNSVTSIGDRAFSGCSGLTSITIPNSVTSIGSYAFSSCSGLTSIIISSSVKSIVDYTFFGCSSLSSISIPNSVTSIGGSAFSDCSSLASISIPNSVTYIGYETFYNCSGLTSITIPNSVTTIEDKAFSGCSGLTSIIVESGNAIYDSRDNCNAIIETSANTLIVGCQSSIIPNSVTSIGDYAFYGCSNLASLTIPSYVTKIGSHAFSHCVRLVDLQVDATIPPTIKGKTFLNVSLSLIVYVPAESVDTYRTAQYWNQFVNIKPQALPQATLTLNADSEMGAAYGAGTYDKGSDVQIFAIDNSGYEFTGWSDGNTDNPRTITLTDNLTLTANFEKIEVAEYTINVSAINPALGTATASELVLVEAVPYPGCTFVCWSDGNFENPRYIPLIGDINLQAIFSGTPTSVAETTDKAHGIVRKVIVDGQLHIIRENRTYTVEGSVVK